MKKSCKSCTNFVFEDGRCSLTGAFQKPGDWCSSFEREVMRHHFHSMDDIKKRLEEDMRDPEKAKSIEEFWAECARRSEE